MTASRTRSADPGDAARPRRRRPAREAAELVARGRADGRPSGRRQVQPGRRRHRGRPGQRGADPRAPARRRGRTTASWARRAPPARHQRRPLGGRPDRRHRQLPLRRARLRGVDRRGGRRGWSPAVVLNVATGEMFTATPAAARPDAPGRPSRCGWPAAARRRWSRPSSPPGSGTGSEHGGAGCGRCQLLPRVRDIRRSAAAALDLCAVAAGRVDAYYELDSTRGITRPARLVAAEAGMVVTGLRVCCSPSRWRSPRRRRSRRRSSTCWPWSHSA